MQKSQITELEIAKQQALSVQGSTSHLKYIGATEEESGRVNLFFKDDDGLYWFTSHFRVGEKLVSEEEYIFGKKIPKRQWKRYSR